MDWMQEETEATARDDARVTADDRARERASRPSTVAPDAVFADASASRERVRVRRAAHHNNASRAFTLAVTELGERGTYGAIGYVRHACARHDDGMFYAYDVPQRLTRNGSYMGRERTHATWLTRTRAAERNRSVRVSDLRERCDAHTHTLRSARSIALASNGYGL